MKARLSEICFHFILPPSSFILYLDSLAACAASLRLAETLRRVRRFNRRSVGARGVLRVEVAAAREDFGQCVEVEDEADGWLAPTEVGRQFVVAPAAPHPRARALDVNLEDEACVVVETRNVREVNRETFIEAERLDDSPKPLKLIECRARALCGQKLARLAGNPATARESREMTSARRGRARPPELREKLFERRGVARVNVLTHL